MKQNEFTGISFSGGECFLVFDRMMKWLSYFKEHLSNIYYWAYTNGLSADEQKLQLLAHLGLNEIRFNIAATGYDSPEILEKIKTSALLFENVAVEIPSIPYDYEKLISVLPQLDRAGVKYLNLHEYMLLPSDSNNHTAKAEQFVLNGNIRQKYDALSKENTERIIAFCGQNRLNIHVNDCSMQKKEYQMIQRRKAMSAMLAEDHERITLDGYLETYFMSPTIIPTSKLQELFNAKKLSGQMRRYLVHPESKKSGNFDNAKICFKLTFIPPMAVNEKRILYRSEILHVDGK